MRVFKKPLRLPLAIGLATTAITAVPVQTSAQSVARGSDVMQLNTGRGRLVTLSSPMSDVFVADDKIADVQVRSPTQLYIFGKAPGETTISATTKTGRIVYASTVRIGNNFDSIAGMLQMALPDARIVATPMNGLVLLTGVVGAPSDAAEAERLVQAFVGDQTKVLSKLRTATPLQVNLQVKFAEVSRSFIKNIGVNLTAQDSTSGFQFGVASGRTIGTIGKVDTSALPQLDASTRFGLPAGSIKLPFDPKIGDFVYPNSGTKYDFAQLANTPQRTALGLAGKLFGLDILSAIDLGETVGQVTTLANPNLTALSGETGTFLAGGEIPIPIQGGLGGITIEYKQYGVSVSFTPTVLTSGRISMKVRPEVSEIDPVNSLVLNGVSVPALTTRRAETAVELSSGQSFAIAGLIQSNAANNVQKLPWLGDIPILGALFRSNQFQRQQTELVIVVTPYIVRPTGPEDAPTDANGTIRPPSDLETLLFGRVAARGHGDLDPAQAPRLRGQAGFLFE